MIKVYPDGPILCSRPRCGRVLGVVRDGGQALQVGGSVFWQSVKFTCEACNRSVTWWPRSLGDDLELTGEQRAVSEHTRLRLAKD
jgi:hypothetical protein